MVLRYHNSMMVQYLREKVPTPGSGRAAQRERTRRDLLASARQLLAAGKVTTVADAADNANVSRTTAYRYFTSQEALLSEAAVEPLIDEIAAIVRDVDPALDAVQRVDEIFRIATPLVLARQAQLQTMLRITLGRSLRENLTGNAPLQSVRWILAWDAALEPLRERVTPPLYVLMTRSLSALLGIETILALKDACDGDDARTAAATRFAARSMVRGFLVAPMVRTSE
ncbi:MAG: TetR/AcrR family transcriptional regulator [Gemmatimonadaceae bacterium]